VELNNKRYEEGMQKGLDMAQELKNKTDRAIQGEVVVADIIKQYFPDCTIESTRGKAASGDRLVTIGDTTILVESKNTQGADKSWITKFDRDLANCKPHAGLYVSLNDTKQPLPLEIRMFGSRPVVYLDNAASYPELIEIAIRQLLFVVGREHDILSNVEEQELKFNTLKTKLQEVVEGPITLQIREFKKCATKLQNICDQLERLLICELMVIVGVEVDVKPAAKRHKSKHFGTVAKRGVKAQT
jgi:hypothetical protein